MKSPPELDSKIVTPTTSPLPKRISLGRRRSGNSPTSLGNALAKTLATLGVIRTKAYGIFLGSCCPAHTSQLSGPLTGIKAHPPTARCDIRSAKLNRIPTPRTVAPPHGTLRLMQAIVSDQRTLILESSGDGFLFLRLLQIGYTD